ncbi:MAG: hypothetical protein ACJ77K_08635 [Bacteroidia bacterium]
MKEENLKILASVIDQEITCLSKIIDWRLQSYKSRLPDLTKTLDDIPFPKFERMETHYSDFISRYSLTHPERILLALAFVPNLKPNFLSERCRTYNMAGTVDRNLAEELPQLGLIRGDNFAGLMPTGFTFVPRFRQ